ncbi:MAG TPA: GntR family transcriptional regulator [Steroidobacteraceae bacterium]|nr:GntR family transcriptional regulator [Steroidobacteraceae bacterium]
MSEGTVLKRICMRDRVRDELITRILDGTYPAGMQLKELTLAREFNVSQAPVREALRELEGTGLVTSERYRGTRVRGADALEMRESYELRAMIEARSVERAAPMPPEVLQQLQASVQAMTQAARTGGNEAYIDHALRFHRLLVQAGGNGTFLSVWDSLRWDVRGRIALRHLIRQLDGLEPMLALHAELVAKLRTNDVRGATQLVYGILERVAAAFNGR